MIIVLEGLEGSGKTTLGLRLAQALPASYIKTPSTEYNAVRSAVAASPSKYTRFYLYLSSLFLAQNELRPFKENVAKHIVVDRYLHSTIAYHDYGGCFVVPPYEEPSLLRADLTVLVTCDPGERQRRKKERGFHLFDRELSNEGAIEVYFRTVVDWEFHNVGDPDKATDDLRDRIRKWLAENVNTLSQ